MFEEPETVQVRTARMQVRDRSTCAVGPEAGGPLGEAEFHVARLRRWEGLEFPRPAPGAGRRHSKGGPRSMTNHRDGDKGSPWAQRQTGLQGQREPPSLETSKLTGNSHDERGLRGHDLHAAGSRIQTRRPGVPGRLFSQGPAGQSPQMPGFCRAPPSNLKEESREEGLRKGSDLLQPESGEHMETARQTAQGPWVGQG